MEECNNIREEFQPNSTTQPSSTSSASTSKSTPRKSKHSSFTPRREAKGSGGVGSPWSCFLGNNRLLLWLLLITIWAYLGFFVQSKWAHVDKNLDFEFDHYQHQGSIVRNSSFFVDNDEEVGDTNYVALLAKKEEKRVIRKTSSRKRVRRSLRGLHKKRKLRVENIEIPLRNATYGFIVGPFGSIEERVLQLKNGEKSFGYCNRKKGFAGLVWSRRFVLIFHELSMTGAPLSMMELGTELLSCGASVSAVVLSKRGGLMQELVRRHIKVLEDKGEHSFGVALKADLVIAGSAVCASWIEQYIAHFPAGASQVAWWIMENRREYFDRSKDVLNKVNMLVFLSESQSIQWQKWCEEENIKLRSKPLIVPLSVNNELAFVAGISSPLNTPSFSAEKMNEKRKLLRDMVRREMKLTDNDMLVISLSSINPGKGQLLLLQSASSVIEEEQFQVHKKMEKSSEEVGVSRKHHRKLLPLDNIISSNSISRREVLSNNNVEMKQSLKILIGSVGSKSNKVDYVKGLLHYLAQHSNLSKSVLWTPATTDVASLYSAADVYVINSQGQGETFGRVTIEAMAFGLPVLGTNAGATKEIVEHNVTGLHHPIGRLGNRVLAQNLRFLLENRLAREQMGMNGRKKVQRMYLKHHMYSKFVHVLVSCMRKK